MDYKIIAALKTLYFIFYSNFILMKTLFSFIFLAIFAFKGFATAQYPDKILYQGKEYDLYSNPMEAFFEKNPDKKPKGGANSTALWRGYVATFEIRDNILYVKDIKIQLSSNEWKSVLSEVFPNQKNIKVDWQTGILVVPHGKLVQYLHRGYESTYEKYILLEISQGNLTKEKQLSLKEYEIFKEKQFEAFKKTTQYTTIKEELKAKGNTDYSIDSYLKRFVFDYSSKILVD